MGRGVTMPDKIAMRVEDVPMRVGSGYPAPHDKPCQQRGRRRLSDPFGLTQYGANQLELPPGSWSSQRHWHERQDEFVLVLQDGVTFVPNEAEIVLKAGMFSVFRAVQANGHNLV